MSDIPHENQPLSPEPGPGPGPVVPQIGPDPAPTLIPAQNQAQSQTQTEEVVTSSPQKRKRGRPPKPRPPAASTEEYHAQGEDSPAPSADQPRPRSRGVPKGNANAAKPGNDLRVEVYLSKTRRAFFEQWFELRYGIKPASEEKLREAVRQIADQAITQTMIEEFERHRPGSVWGSGGEVF